MESGSTHVWELDSAADVMKVLVPFQNLGLVCCQVRADEAERGGVKKKPDDHTPFIPRLPGHSCLHRRHRHIPATTSFVWLSPWQQAPPT